MFSDYMFLSGGSVVVVVDGSHVTWLFSQVNEAVGRNSGLLFLFVFTSEIKYDAGQKIFRISIKVFIAAD